MSVEERIEKGELEEILLDGNEVDGVDTEWRLRGVDDGNEAMDIIRDSIDGLYGEYLNHLVENTKTPETFIMLYNESASTEYGFDHVLLDSDTKIEKLNDDIDLEIIKSLINEYDYYDVCGNNSQKFIEKLAY